MILFISLIIWMTITQPGNSVADSVRMSIVIIRPPVWEVANPISKVFVLDSIPATKGSLAAKTKLRHEL